MALVLLGLQIAALHAFGQPWTCECGFINLWAGNPLSPENSQQFFDWYTFSHIIHGFIFFWLARYLFPGLSLGVAFAAAVGIEVGWEMLENTPWLIEHYRQQALAQGYVGDSVLNSVMDTFAMVFGFFFASRMPLRAVVAIAVAMEGLALFMIRDSLLLNMINLVFPFDFIAAWQNGG